MISYRRAASGLSEMLTVIEQHKSEAQITGIHIPPPGRDKGIQAAAGCHLAVDTPATAGVRGLHVHNDDLRARARIAAANLPPHVIDLPSRQPTAQAGLLTLRNYPLARLKVPIGRPGGRDAHEVVAGARELRSQPCPQSTTPRTHGE
jgi:hypothetical protein